MIAELTQRLLDREHPMRIHLLGVAGSGMSGLALLLLEMGHAVSGEDRVTSGETERLRGLGLRFSSPHSAEDLSAAELVVYSSAFRADHPARVAAGDAGVPAMRRAECLAAVLHAKAGVIVSGTHGKTTTSAMCAHVLNKGGEPVSHYVGAEIPVLGANAHWDEDSEFLIAEGDESDGTLALYQPAHAIVLNIEAEHLDFYKNLDEIKEVFTTLLEQTSRSVIYCAEDATASELCAARPGAVSYGWDGSGADFVATDVTEGRGSTSFTVVGNGTPLGRAELGIPGRHNVLNALAAVALAHGLGVDFNLVARSLASFAGARRRFETSYKSPRFRIVDDYGHHPTEIAATLQTARSLKPDRLVVLFQPHRYSRTQRLAEEFGAALQAADLVFVTDVYPASEAPIDGVSGETIVDAVKRHGDTECRSVPDLATAHHVVGNALREGDLVLTLGAGNVHEAGGRLGRDLRVLDQLLWEAGEMPARLYEPMRRHTTMLVGGPAQFWIEPTSIASFAKAVGFFKDFGFPVRVVGRGSNLLVRDGGIRGAVIHPSKGEFGDVRVDAETGEITAGAGVRFKKLASAAQAAGLGGFEWMEGVPGNVGGGLRMNAGAMGVETFDQVVSVTFLDEDGEIRTRTRDEIEAHYRNVPELRRNYALEATFRGKAASPEAIANELARSKAHRRETQPIAASAGCIFKNPEGIGAGKLIDELGLKGRAVGKAEVSAEHGNFIVNRGQASAGEVLQLIADLKAEAKSSRDIELHTEVQIIGEDGVSF
ncbi:MAG: UDP-N-acetylmuramate--L-alanine ligase [Akkermansiaceae bacterium]|nr:UDP-N-acetylmuramate--L-alanine ligase [Akkermansiaceae bacterium]NNM28833.1 UDP-N-acetylmuramate--L-alanine ligase [Akkermansiaceae bacterium]